MKKYVFMAVFAAVCGMANASDGELPIRQPIQQRVYRGLWASHNPSNPCGGLALFVCAKVTTYSDGDGNLEEVVEDMDGNVFKRNPDTGDDWIIEHIGTGDGGNNDGSDDKFKPVEDWLD